MPDFDLPTTDGQRIRKSDFVGRKPLLMLCASVTCPLVASAAPLLRRLHAEFGNRVAFVSLYVREAHPGERYPQPHSLDQKLRHAAAYRERDRIEWPVAVDDVEGGLHRALDPRANAAYLMGTDGRVVSRSLCSNDDWAIHQALLAVASGRSVVIREHQRLAIPLLRGLGTMDQTLELSGRQARRDVLQEMPILYGLARVAALFGPLPPLGRGIAALGSVCAALAGLTAIGWKVAAATPREDDH